MDFKKFIAEKITADALIRAVKKAKTAVIVRIERNGRMIHLSIDDVNDIDKKSGTAFGFDQDGEDFEINIKDIDDFEIVN